MCFFLIERTYLLPIGSRRQTTPLKGEELTPGLPNLFGVDAVKKIIQEIKDN